ncbi:hypothetical protein [Pseudomonas sp. PGPR40]|uniref:hypothetical protein n=1 Tax=Pseudomonas sp. PGPR40 TaxID=2913476 RepID=UPI001EDC5198|nr:hypothetical protein [Pseudomonas sp. PGPR40]
MKKLLPTSQSALQARDNHPEVLSLSGLITKRKSNFCQAFSEKFFLQDAFVLSNHLGQGLTAIKQFTFRKNHDGNFLPSWRALTIVIID